jgi:hypothetical protein
MIYPMKNKLRFCSYHVNPVNHVIDPVQFAVRIGLS